MTDTQEMTDTQRMSKLNSYYFNSELSDNENENSVVRKLINKYQVEENSETDSMDYNVKRNKDRQSEIRMITCKLCLDENTDKGNYIILSCNHIYHIKCLAEEHFNDVLKYPLLEDQMTKIKNDLRVCYDYKHKLEQEREKSKQIVSILSTMI